MCRSRSLRLARSSPSALPRSHQVRRAAGRIIRFFVWVLLRVRIVVGSARGVVVVISLLDFFLEEFRDRLHRFYEDRRSVRESAGARTFEAVVFLSSAFSWFFPHLSAFPLCFVFVSSSSPLRKSCSSSHLSFLLHLDSFLLLNLLLYPLLFFPSSSCSEAAADEAGSEEEADEADASDNQKKVDKALPTGRERSDHTED